MMNESRSDDGGCGRLRARGMGEMWEREDRLAISRVLCSDVIVPLCGSVCVCGRDEGSGGHKPGVCFDVQL